MIKHQYYCTKCNYHRDGLLNHKAVGIGGYEWLCPRCKGQAGSYEVEVEPVDMGGGLQNQQNGFDSHHLFHDNF